MNFIHEWGFDVKEGKTGDFLKWLENNEEKFAASYPDGIEHDGIYAAIFTSEKDNGAFRFIVRMDSYAGQDTLSQAMKDGGPFATMMEELTDFMDQRNDSNWSQHLMRRVSDTAFWGE